MIYKTALFKKESQLIIAKFPLEDSKTLEKISQIPHVMMGYDFWEIPVNRNNIELLKKLRFELSASLKNWDDTKMEIVPQMKMSEPKDGLILYPYQVQGVSFIQSRNGRALIADEMGLGKTVQALSWLEMKKEIRPVLIICPSSLKINWERETEKWLTNPKIEILYGTKPKMIAKNKDIVIVNYDILPDWLDTLKSKRFQALIVDEVHYIKNNKAQRTKAFKRLTKGVPNLVALSGTPIENKPIELYNILQALDNKLFPNYYSFINRFCAAKRNGFGWDTSGASNTAELNSILKGTIMIRRKKIDVLKELPPKLIIKVPLEIDNREVYMKAENAFIEFIRNKYSKMDNVLEEELKQFAKRKDIDVGDDLTQQEIEMLRHEKVESVSKAPVLSQIETLKQLAVEGKLKEIVNWIETFLESGEKLVVFAIHKKVIDKLMERFPDAVKVDGSVSQKERQNAVDKFQKDDKIKLFIGNIKAAGVGITLTSASNVVILEYPWSPSILSQAIDRVHRITQKHQVTAWNLVGQDTIEEKIIDILKKKNEIISQILDGEVFQDTSVLMELINSYKQIRK